MNPRANSGGRANLSENLKFMRVLGYEHPMAGPVLQLRHLAIRMIRVLVQFWCFAFFRAKLADFLLNTQTPCPPRGACPRKPNLQRIRYGCDRMNDVGQSVGDCPEDCKRFEGLRIREFRSLQKTTLIGGGAMADVWRMNGFQTTGPMTDAIQCGSAQWTSVCGRVSSPSAIRDRMPSRFLTHF